MSEFTFRKIDYNDDIPEVVELIKKNLDSTITREFFNWKHYENPFGKSYGLLALNNNQIVGLRMFMFWKFYNPVSKELVRAIRPVDTVTDINYRGKGMFKKLTLQGLEECQGSYDVVFNTPNENSRPGYNKMGWESLLKINHFKLGVVNRFKPQLDFEEIKNFLPFENTKAFKDLYATHKSKDFFTWRYSSNDYRIAAFEEPDCFLVYKVSKINGFLTVIIFEILGNRSFFTRMLRAVCRRNYAQLVYFYNSEEFESVKFIKSFKRAKPVVVYKEDKLNIFKNINFSMGDLEGKL